MRGSDGADACEGWSGHVRVVGLVRESDGAHEWKCWSRCVSVGGWCARVTARMRASDGADA